MNAFNLEPNISLPGGEKKHVCQECGKGKNTTNRLPDKHIHCFHSILTGFYRKDHLRKHTRSHIARRVKSEVSSQSNPNANTMQSTTIPNNS